MLDYDTTMLEGAHAYCEELNALRAAGITAAFTQTGGMNAAWKRSSTAGPSC